MFRLSYPRFNELAIYLMSLSFLLLFVVSEGLREVREALFLLRVHPMSILLLSIPTLGMLASVFNVFAKRQISKIEKGVMLSFAILVNVGSGIAAGLHMIPDSEGLLIVFPAWNLVYAGWLILLGRLGYFDEDSFSNEDASLPQVIVGTAAVIAAFYVCQYRLSLYWAVTFSICVGCSAGLGAVIDSFHPSRAQEGRRKPLPTAEDLIRETKNRREPREPGDFKWMGASFSEKDYRRARRHNLCRWVVTWALSVPAFLGCLFFGLHGFQFEFDTPGESPFRFIVIGIFLAVLVTYGIYSGATSIFPGSKIYGSTVYRKYELFSRR